MTSFPSSTANKPSGIVVGQLIDHNHVGPAWDEIISIENILLGSTSLGASGLTINSDVGTAALTISQGQLSIMDTGSMGGIMLGGGVSLYSGTGGVLETAEQLSLPTQGPLGGIAIGTDTYLYRPTTEPVIESINTFSSVGSVSTDLVFQGKVDGDTYNRLSVQADGQILWGSGSGSTDASIYRSSPGQLTISATTSISGDLAVTSAITSGGTPVVLSTNAALTNSRTPTGPAGGDLAGSYPNPTLASLTGPTGTYASVTIDSKGRVTAGSNPAYVADVSGTSGRISLATGPSGPTGSVVATFDLASNIVSTGAGTYKSVTVDTYGRVTSGTNPNTLALYGINDAQPLDSTGILASIPSLAGTGFIVKTATGTTSTASIATASSARITVSNGSGVSGNPTLDLASGVISSTGTYRSVTVDTYGRVTAGTNPTTLSGYGITDAVSSSSVIVSSVTGPSGRVVASVSGPTGSNAITLELGTTGTAGTYNSVTTDAYGRVTNGSTSLLVASVTGPNRLLFSVTGPTGSNAVSIDLPTGVASAGTYQSVVVDTYGRVTSGSNPTTLVAHNIVDQIVTSVTGPSSQLTFSVTGPTTANAITVGLPTTGTSGTYNSVTTDAYGRVTAGSNPTYIAGVAGTSGRVSLSTGPSGPTGSVLSTIDLASNVISSTGTYRSVTVDTYGRVTAGTNPTTLSGYGITDAVNNSSVIVSSVTGPSGQLTFSVSGPTGANAITVGLQTTGAAGTYNSVTTDTYGRVTSGSNSIYVAGVSGTSGRISLATGPSGPTGSVLATLDLSTAGTAGTYTSVTTDAYGRVTSGSNPTPSKATNVAGGLAGQIHYQSSADTTAFLATGPTGSVLTSFGGATGPIWSTTLSNVNVVGPTETFATTTGLTGPVNFDAKTQSVVYANNNATANWWLNVRGNSTTTLSSLLSVGQAITISVLSQNGSSAYYPTGPSGPIAIDGVGVTPKWFTGTAPTSGNANSTDVYTFTIMKTAATPTYTVLASTAKFA